MLRKKQETNMDHMNEQQLANAEARRQQLASAEPETAVATKPAVVKPAEIKQEAPVVKAPKKKRRGIADGIFNKSKKK
jgi:hypothetical protein